MNEYWLKVTGWTGSSPVMEGTLGDDHVGDVYALDDPYLSPAEKSILRQYRMTRRHTDTLSNALSSPGAHYIPDHAEPATPPLLSSPSVISLSSEGAYFAANVTPARRQVELAQSLQSPLPREGAYSAAKFTPIRRHVELAQSLQSPPSHEQHRSLPPPHGKAALARRLGQLAQRLTLSDDIDELALSSQLDQLERTVSLTPPPPPPPPPPPQVHTPIQSRPGHGGIRSHSDLGGVLSSYSPASSLIRSRFSDLSPSALAKVPEPTEENDTAHDAPKKGMTERQANKVIIEAAKLNKELTVVVDNLKARLEESDHIHSLLIERAERAAQRIIFLQNRISYLEEELQENDDELQHFRICLKAVEIQLPPNPDHEIQRCISAFKEDYKALKKKRASRSSINSFSSLDNSQI